MQPAPQDRVSLWGVAFLYLYGGIGYVVFLISIYRFMGEAGRVLTGLRGGFLFYSFCGLLLGLLVVMIFFLGALRFAKPENDDALEVFAFPAFLIISKNIGGVMDSRRSKTARDREAAAGSYAAHDGFFSRIIVAAEAMEAEPTPGHPPVLHSGKPFRNDRDVHFPGFLLDYRREHPARAAQRL